MDEPKKRGRPGKADKKSRRTYSFRLPEKMMDLFEELAEKQRRTQTGQLILLIEAALVADGKDPAEWLGK